MDEGKSIDILLVEDSASDARLIVECFAEATVPNRIQVVHDGEEALTYLHRGVEYADAPRPDLIILDLNLPKVSGLDVLAAAKANEALRNIPVIVLTASAREEDIHRAYELQASCYLNKPGDVQGFIDMVKTIERYWLDHAELPPDGRSGTILLNARRDSGA